MPSSLVIRGAEGFRSARWYRPDEQLDDVTGMLSFHDPRGFIVDPIYVAGLFADLLSPTSLPGLVPASVTSLANGAGGVQSIAGLAAAGTIVHLIDPHGNPMRIATPGAALITDDGAGVSTGNVTGNLLTLAAGNRIAPNALPAVTPLRLGFATNGTMSAAPLLPPPLAAGTIPRRFYRVMVVDQNW